MDSLKRELLARRQSLEKAIEKAVDVISAAPEGSLRIDASKGITRFFHMQDEKTKKVYITKDNAEVITKLANKEYAEKVLEKAQKELREIDRYMSMIQCGNADMEYSKLNDTRKNLVAPILLDKDTSISKWNSQPYERSTNHPEHLRFKTRRGEMVRSKSEAFIANTYLDLGIPYRYECALTLKSNVLIHPDFTILDINHRRIMYHEHLGRMDKPEYVAEQMWKLREYQKNGIFIGKNLIVTFESEEYPFDPERFRNEAREIFLG